MRILQQKIRIHDHCILREPAHLRDLFQLIDKLQRVAEQPDYIIKANRRVNHFEYNPARFMADQSPVIRLVRVQPRFYISK